MLWLGLLACWAADRTGASLARERPYYRPLSLLLAVNVATELTRYFIKVDVLAYAARPFTGLSRVAFHVEQAAGLIWPVGVTAVALMVLARKPAWPAFLAGGGLLLARIADYPWLRQERLAWLLLGEQVALVALLVWSAWRLPKHTRTVDRSPAPVLLEHHRAMLWIAAMEASMLAGPHFLLRGTQFERWWIAQVGYTGLFLWLSILQWRWACQARRLIS